MAVLDDVKELLKQYTAKTAPTGDVGAHFQQVAESVDSGTLAGGIADALRSDKTPPFSQLVSQLFGSGSGEQKSAMINTLLSAIPAEQRAKLSSMIPGLTGIGDKITTSATKNFSVTDVEKLAKHAEQQDGTVVDKMGAIYAQHPALFKTLGAGALAIAMRAMSGSGQK